jgi:hypothetical protein
LVFLEEKNNFLNEKINLNFDFSNNFYSQNINNEKFNLNKKFLDVYSNNQTIRTSEKFIKKYINLKSSKSDLNLSNNLNSLQNLFSAITEQINPALIPFLFSNFG